MEGLRDVAGTPVDWVTRKVPPPVTATIDGKALTFNRLHLTEWVRVFDGMRSLQKRQLQGWLMILKDAGVDEAELPAAIRLLASEPTMREALRFIDTPEGQLIVLREGAKLAGWDFDPKSLDRLGDPVDTMYLVRRIANVAVEEQATDEDGQEVSATPPLAATSPDPT